MTGPREWPHLTGVGWYQAVIDMDSVSFGSHVGSLLNPVGRIRKGDRTFVYMEVWP